MAFLKVEEIRPEKMIAEYMKVAKETDEKWWLKVKKDFVRTECPVCGKSMHHKLFEKNQYVSYDICDDCETIFLNPRPDLKTIVEFYKNSKSLQLFSEIYKTTNQTRIDRIYKPRLKRLIDTLKKYNADFSSVLEVGAGSGAFLKLAKDENVFKEIVAVEPTPSNAEICKKNGLKVIEKNIESVTKDEVGDINLVVCFELIEHLTNPSEFVQSVDRLLQKNGLFVFTCPNGLGFDVLEMGEISTTTAIVHMNLFNPKSIKKLVEKNGFKVLTVTTPGELDVDIVKNAVKNGDYNLKEWSFLSHLLIKSDDIVRENFQKFLIENNLSSHMWVVCQKN